jgi:hypothetical protein
MFRHRAAIIREPFIPTLLCTGRFPDDGIPVPKHVGVFLVDRECVLLRAKLVGVIISAFNLGLSVPHMIAVESVELPLGFTEKFLSLLLINPDENQNCLISDGSFRYRIE